MKKIIPIIFLSIILFAGLVLADDNCPPNLPQTYGGTVSFNGKLVQGEFNLVAMINGKISGNTKVVDSEYYVDVSPCYQITSGEIKFIINGVTANEVEIYSESNAGKVIGLNLTLSSLPSGDNYCGNGKIESGEECDDGNNKSGDGCSYDICEVEFNYNCKGSPSVCAIISAPYCGDGIVNNGETCSSCPADVGACASSGSLGGGSSGGGGGGGGGGSSRSSTSSSNTNNLVTLSTNSTEGENLNETSTENLDEENKKGITGFAVADFVKTKGGKISIGILILIILGLIFVSVKKDEKEKSKVKPKKTNGKKVKEIKVVKLSELKKRNKN